MGSKSQRNKACSKGWFDILGSRPLTTQLKRCLSPTDGLKA
ncbi:hypothetical protein CCACVL1_20930 [Corchorus capsularis]|uniref:Uncharacterized protein n=1 Tax=Corchorus capsularis TaxID=210143 RepID=A0A1R3H9B0_COCAP|nr:hypothetical protein CCACVL1_20930 [Corchorus capsularis]